MACDMSMTSSPTPAVLPDARALDDLASRIYAVLACDEEGSLHVLAAMRGDPNARAGDLPMTARRLAVLAQQHFATSPASDAAVPAGERYCANCTCDACRRAQQRVSMAGALAKDANSRCWSCSCGWVGCYTQSDIAKYGEPSECNLCCRERLVECDPPQAAAPKVASDTGAGLREAERLCRDTADRATHMLDREDRRWHPTRAHYEGLRNALRNAERQIAAALATDATDGATGGGEAWTFTPDEREKAAILSLCADQELSPTSVIRQALRLYQHDHCRRKDGETVTWSGDAQRARDFAGPLATTPGGDLLEQVVAIVNEEGPQNPESDWTDYARARAAMRDAILKRIRALSARNQTDDGGAQ